MIDFSHPEILDCVRRALDEDIGPGDVTSESCVPAHRMAHGRFIAREHQIVAGTELLPMIYQARGGVEHLHIEIPGIHSDQVSGYRGLHQAALGVTERPSQCMHMVVQRRPRGLFPQAGRAAEIA